MTGHPVSVSMSGFTPNAQKILAKRYLIKNEDGSPQESIPDLFHRVARAVAEAESRFSHTPYTVDQLADKFYQLMITQEFLPNSPTLMNAGKALGQLSACFVLPVGDSLDSIFDSIKFAAMIHKSGGGTGFSFTRLRPANDIVATTNGVSSGPVSFMRVFNIATETIKQGGTRRGANMGILRVDHPDILEFIKAKESNESLNNFNISVAITDRFMEALTRGEDFELMNPRTSEVVKRLNARKVFNLIVEGAWRNGEPGIIFIDRINRDNPTPQIGLIESTNPCGEQPLLPYESCNLGSINVSRFIIPEGAFSRIDYPRLKQAVHLGIRFLDNVIEVNRYPLPEIEQMTKANRKIGLGIMGWADLLLRLRIPYNSEMALNTAEQLMSFIQRESWTASEKLAQERGPFLNFALSALEKRGLEPVRNATVTTIAPTGTISMIANCSSGIEPLFAVAYEKHVMDGERLVEVNPEFLKVAEERGFYSPELMETVARKGYLEGIEGIPPDVRMAFVTSHEIAPEWHVRMQAAFQKYTDNAVSKTVNFSHQASMKDVEQVYLLAHTLGCKGITVYRDGSRESQVVNIGSNHGQAPTGKSEAKQGIVPRSRPDMTTGTTEKVQIGCGNLYITVNADEKGICEVFTSLGRAGGCPSQSEATSRLVSAALRSGIKVDEIIDQLKGIRCLSTLKRGGTGNGMRVLSCPDAIGKAIERFARRHDDENADKPHRTVESTQDSTREGWSGDNESQASICPDCGEALAYEGGCNICRSCGFSRCG